MISKDIAPVETPPREILLPRLRSLAEGQVPGAWENEYRAIQGNPVAKVAYERTQSRIAALTAIELEDQIRDGLLTKDDFLGIVKGIKRLAGSVSLSVGGEAGLDRDVWGFVKAVLEFAPPQAEVRPVQAVEPAGKTPDPKILTRRQFFRLFGLGVGGAVAATKVGKKLMALAPDKPKRESPGFNRGLGVPPIVEGGEPSQSLGEPTGQSEQPAPPEEPPKDLFRDVWLPAVLTWADERAQQKQADDPEFLARIEPAFLPIDAENRTGRVNFLILGEGGEGMLTDVIMIFSFDAAGNQIDLLSLPRDLYAPEAGGRINRAFYQGKKLDQSGFPLTEKIIEDATGLPVHFGGYFKMEAISSLVDYLDGIEVEIPKTIETYVPDMPNPTYVFEAGTRRLDGLQTLRYVRSRLGGDDFSRQGRQQQIVEALIAKARTHRKTMMGLVKFFLWDIDQQLFAGNLAFDVDLDEARKRIFGVGLESIVPVIQAKLDEGANLSLPTVGRRLDLRQADLYETGRIDGDKYQMTVIGAESLSDPTRYWGPIRKWTKENLAR